MAKARITVLQRALFRDLVESQLPREVWDNVALCEFFEEGQEFIVGPDSPMPKGFCPVTWQHFSHMKLPLVLRDEDPCSPMITCCMDGLRPVSFRIDRIED